MGTQKLRRDGADGFAKTRERTPHGRVSQQLFKPQPDMVEQVALTVDCVSPKQIPFNANMQRDDSDWSHLSTIYGGVTLTPEMVGLETFNLIVAEAKQMVELCSRLNYMERFAIAVAEMCTTVGIVKRLWPECTTFMSSETMKMQINQVKPSGYPLAAKKQLSDFTKNDRAYISKKYLHAQMKVITDTILATKLMPPKEEMHWVDGEPLVKDEHYKPHLKDTHPEKGRITIIKA